MSRTARANICTMVAGGGCESDGRAPRDNNRDAVFGRRRHHASTLGR
jgi:hypothetical protein